MITALPSDRPRRFATALFAVLLAGALLATLLPAAAPAPARAAEGSADCVGALECLTFRSGFSDIASDNIPDADTWYLRPTLNEPESAGDAPWQGTFQIVLRSSIGTDDEQCLQATGDDADLRECGTNSAQRWFFQPAATQVNTQEGGWNPWWPVSRANDWPRSEAIDGKFYIRSAGHGKDTYGCLITKKDGLIEQAPFGQVTATIKNCDSLDATERAFAQFNVYDYEGAANRYTLSPEHRDELTKAILSSAVAHAVARCGKDPSRCAGLLRDGTTGEQLSSQWERVDRMKIVHEPRPVWHTIGCAGPNGTGSTAQSIFNGGSAPLTTTISAGGSNSYSTSVTTGLSVTTSYSFDVGAFLSASVEVQTSTEWGKVWSDTETVEQEVSWTIPPQRYATAVLAAKSVQATARWRFDSGAMQWTTDEAARLTVPHASNPSSSTPDSTLAVFNSLGRKSCGATTPSVLDPEQTIAISNTTAPGRAPAQGDVLAADAEADWWTTDSADDTGVHLRFQWYRQRGDATPVPIPGAVGKTYRVTQDDVTETELLDRVGRYRLRVGVTDVADESRFDSQEYTSVATAGVVDKRTTESLSLVALSILDPSPESTERVVADVRVTAPAAADAPTGSVSLLADGDEIGSAELDARGLARFRIALPRGTHHLDARYDGDAVLDPSGSDTAIVRVRGAESVTRASVEQPSPRIGERSAVLIDVSGSRSGTPTPTGRAEVTVDGVPLTADATLDEAGRARVELPAFATAGRRTIAVTYLGDDVFDPSNAGAAELVVAAPATVAKISLPQTVVARGKPFSARVSVASKSSGAPVGGRVRLLIDGRATGSYIRLDERGRATLRATAPRTGKLAVSFLHVPSAAEPGATQQASPRAALHVRSHAAAVTLRSDLVNLRPGKRIVLSGKVRIAAKSGAKRPSVVITRNGKAVRTVRVDAKGRYRVVVKARAVAKGRHEYRAGYRGSSLRSIAPATSAKLTILRR
ncbi:Ig-like domain repeat protein [Leucobacter weissii]|uniref:Ig-like domain repeat protein n=1 Tax=Leucobacter weissii TaxID=1983706 RepID=A0A939MIS7_9MICO|nr:Ig-like domain repeat protein [Leucobacter weissii]MBO1900780.1 Ig-like domain repeat protein [Leucobacter weissii]